MKLKPVFAAISILMGMLGLAACGQNSDQVVYQYPKSARESWTCFCGATNAGKYCTECGISKPPDNFSWTCSCGAENRGKFCTECGRPF